MTELERPIVGFRRWMIKTTGSDQLSAMYYDVGDPWAKRETTARCIKTGCRISERAHVSPSWDSKCGLYAEYRPTSVRAQSRIVDGVIAGHGHFVEHTTGFRVQHATILAIYDLLPLLENNPYKADVMEWRAAIFERVAARYDIPIIEPDQAVDYAANFGELMAPMEDDEP